MKRFVFVLWLKQFILAPIVRIRIPLSFLSCYQKKKKLAGMIDHIIKSLETPNVAYAGPTSLLIFLSIPVWSNFSVFLMLFSNNHVNNNVNKHVQVEALTNQEEVELRAKIEALGLEVTKVSSNPTQNLDEVT